MALASILESKLPSGL
ncbi:uncharacterized protein FFMR_00218 [Fusarium fujikuroi]|nr:uncharacterized protein FFMR_00218 [Fusarium fujikuroi]